MNGLGMEAIATIRLIFYFIIAGLCEIGGGHLVWLWLREGKSS
jgi:small multidrug resistance family-3 protein